MLGRRRQASEPTPPADADSAGGVVSTRPLSGVTRDSAKSASQVSRSTAAMSTLSAQRPTPPPNSRLTGDRPAPKPPPFAPASGANYGELLAVAVAKAHRRSGFTTPRKGARRNPAGAALSLSPGGVGRRSVRECRDTGRAESFGPGGNDAEQAVITHENCGAGLRQAARALMVARRVLRTLSRSRSFPACGAVSTRTKRLGSPSPRRPCR